MSKRRNPLGPAAPRMLLMAMLLAACGSAPATAVPDGSPTAAQASPAPASAAPPDRTADPPVVDPVASALAWLVGLGPGAPEGPDEVDVYQLILGGSEDSCRLALQTEMDRFQDLYHGAAAACLAALHGRSNRWPEAELARAAYSAPPEGCLDRQVYDLLDFVLDAHRANPDARFTLHGNDSHVAPRCPVLSDLTVARDDSGNLDIAVRGDRLGRVLVLRYKFVDGCPVPVNQVETESVELVDRTRESARAVLNSIAVRPDASFIWVGLVAAPDPWIADGKCVAIGGATPSATPSASPTDASPTPAAST